MGDRIYPLILPQNVAYPAMQYQRIDTPRPHTKAGPTGDANPRVQIGISATSYPQAKAVAEAVRMAMKGFPGIRGGHRAASVICEDDRDDYEPEPSPPVFRVILDFTIWFEEG